LVQACNIAIWGVASHNFLILSAKSKPVLDFICNRFAAELNEISVSQVECGEPELSKGDPVEIPPTSRIIVV